MLPKAFVDSYKQYKANTTEALSWLVENCPTSVDVLGQPNVVKAPRLKGKQRKAQSESVATQTYTLKARQILLLVRNFTANPTVTVQVPRRTIQILEQAIRLRRRSTAWYMNQPHNSKQVQQRTRSHQFFSDILIKVLEAFKKRNALATSNPASSSIFAEEKTSIPPIRSENIFDVLELEDPISEDEVYTDKHDGDKAEDKKSERTAKTLVDVEEVQTSTEEIIFKIFCVIQDLERLRLFIRQTWEAYRVGSISLMNASSCTNIALHFARGVEERYMASLSQSSDCSEVIAALSQIFTDHDNLGDSQEDILISFSKNIYQIPYRILSEHRQHDFVEVYLPRVKGQLSDLDLEIRDSVLLAQMLYEYPLINIWDTPAKDEISMGLLALPLTKKLKLSHVFGCQILLDIHHTLGDALSCAIRDLRVGAAAMKSAVDTFLKTENVSDVKIDIKISDDLRFHSEWIGKNINKDALKGIRLLCLDSDAADRFRLKPFFMLSQQPLLCGTLLTALTLELQRIGLQLVNRNSTAVDVAHLYNAVRQSDLMFFSWPAMDRLIATWTPGRFFIGSQPTEPQGFRKRYQLMTGVSPANFASDHERRCRAFSKGEKVAYVNSTKDFREPCEYPPVMDHFCQWYSASKKIKNITVEHIEALLNTLLAPAEQRSQRRSNTNEAMSPVKMLYLLQDAFAKEEPLLLLDYFTIHRRMLEVLHQTELAVHEELAFWYIETRGRKARKSSHSLFMSLVADSILELGAAPTPYNRKLGEDMLIAAGEIIEKTALRGLATENGRLFEAIRINQVEATSLSRDAASDVNHTNQGGGCVHFGLSERSNTPVQLGPACLWGILESCPVISCQKGTSNLGDMIELAIITGFRRLEEL